MLSSSRECNFQNRHAPLYLTCITSCEAQDQRGLLLVPAAHAIDPNSTEREGVIKRAAKDGFDAALVTATSDALAHFFSHLKPKAPIAFPNGVEPKPRFNGHPVSAFDGAMSHEAFEKLNAAIGTRSLPLRTQVFPFKDVVAAHHRIEEGHVAGKIVLHVDL